MHKRNITHDLRDHQIPTHFFQDRQDTYISASGPVLVFEKEDMGRGVDKNHFSWKLGNSEKQLLAQNAYYSYITHDQKRLLGCKHQKGHFEFHPCAPYLDRHVQQYPLFLGR